MALHGVRYTPEASDQNMIRALFLAKSFISLGDVVRQILRSGGAGRAGGASRAQLALL